MRRSIAAASTLSGTMRPPGDKSISHRSTLLNAIALGNATVTNYSSGADCTSTIRCLKALGVQIDRLEESGSYRIHGVGMDGLNEPSDVLNSGNSGTTMRLITGLLAGQSFLSVVTGDNSLRSRPMGRIIVPLSEMGARIQGREANTKAPLVVHGGQLRGIQYNMPVASAQLKSCLIIAGLFAEGDTILDQPATSRDHTERMLTQMGATLVEDGLTITVKPRPNLEALDVNVPADISSAAYWIVAGVCHPDARITVTNVGVNPTRLGIVDALRAMGGRITLSNHRREGGEEVADITAESSQLRGSEFGGDLIPRLLDEGPVLALAACFAEGTTVIRDAQELRVKESDRIKTTTQELSRIGANIEERPDGMVIHGGRKLKGAVCQSHSDHRLAMTLGIAGLLAEGMTTVQGAEIASISYPTFWNDLESLTKSER